MPPVARPLLQSLKKHAALLLGLLAIMWALEIVDFLLLGRLIMIGGFRQFFLLTLWIPLAGVAGGFLLAGKSCRNETRTCGVASD